MTAMQSAMMLFAVKAAEMAVIASSVTATPELLC
jgi:hypothetical protein